MKLHVIGFDHLIHIFLLFLKSILNEVEGLPFTQLPLTETPYFRASVSVSPFLCGLKLIVFLYTFYLSFRTDLLDFRTGTDISIIGSAFSSQG